MTSEKTFIITVCIACLLLGAIAFWVSSRQRDTPSVEHPSDDVSHNYQSVSHMVDREHRVAPLDGSLGTDTLDLSSLKGMPYQYHTALSTYMRAIINEIGSIPLKRRKYYHADRQRFQNEAKLFHAPYPDDANPKYDRDVVIPLSLLPRPESVHRWSKSTVAQSLDWKRMSDAIQNRGVAFGRTVIFKKGSASVNPLSFPAVPFEASIPSWIMYTPDHDTSYFLELGKVVLTPHFDNRTSAQLTDRSDSLLLGKPNGATQLAELTTIPVCTSNTRLRWTMIQNGSDVRQFLAYALIDGNGALQRTAPGSLWTTQLTSPYIRPLQCSQHQPKVNQHDELLLPTPRVWTLEDSLHNENTTAHEEWCLNDWFPAQKDACWVIREAEDSKPLQESFLLMPALEPSERPVFFVSVFAETEPTQLVRELAALHKVSPEKVLNSPETMARLQSLYEKVRDFPLAD